MSLRDQLQAIYDEKGVLTPAVLVDVARPSDHPLHDRFEWDDAIAGEAWRRRQAHELIRSVRVVYREPTEQDPGADVRAWHAVRGEDERSYVYEPAERVATDEFLSALVLRDMERQWKELHRRFGAFQAFVDMVRGDLSEPKAA